MRNENVRGSMATFNSLISTDESLISNYC